MKDEKKFNTQKLVVMAIMTAIVVLLQILAILTRPLLPLFSITLVLMPIVIGAALIGVGAGGWLGFVFGVAVLFSGDANVFLAINPAGTVITVLAKGALAGFAAGLAYKILSVKSKTLGAIATAVICPIVNTGIFTLGSYVFFYDTLSEWGIAEGFTSVAAFLFIVMIGINFIIELGLNIVLCPAIIRLIQYGQKTFVENK